MNTTRTPPLFNPNGRFNIPMLPIDPCILPGWQIYSLPLLPDDTPIEQALASIDGYYNLVYAYDAMTQAWKHYDLNAPDYANTISTVGPSDGLWINGILTSTITISNTSLNSTPISLEPGWNLVGLPVVHGRRSLTEVLAPIDGQFDLVYSYEAGKWLRYAPNDPDFVDTLREL